MSLQAELIYSITTEMDLHLNRLDLKFISQGFLAPQVLELKTASGIDTTSLFKKKGKKNPPNMVAVAARLKTHVYSREITHKLKPI